MEQKIRNNIPNILSALRIVLSALLFSITNNIALFFGVYSFAGLTDIADGFIARKYYMETSLGVKLDSLADFIFLIASLLRMVLSYQLKISLMVLISCVIIAIIRIINFIITKIKFQQWGMLHSIGNKITGLIIFFICPIAILTGQFPIVAVIIPLLSALEETVFLLISHEYNPNAKSIFIR
ncbi:MAG: CDP-alcohol phosphatidyltransferase family protein [Lachnospiraceae bacterium]